MPARRFRKRPVEVEAFQWTGDNEAEVAAWAGVLHLATPSGRPGRPVTLFHGLTAADQRADLTVTAEVFDRLHSTWVGVKTGHWVIRGVQGELCPIAEDVLAETYDPVDEG